MRTAEVNVSYYHRAVRTRKAFTLIELLVVILILSILMAVALPLYLKAVADSQKKTFRSNIQTISNAVETASVMSGELDYSTIVAANSSGLIITGTDSLGDLNAVPVCPSAGTYTLIVGNGGPSTFAVSCTAVGHGTFQPGVDHN